MDRNTVPKRFHRVAWKVAINPLPEHGHIFEGRGNVWPAAIDAPGHDPDLVISSEDCVRGTNQDGPTVTNADILVLLSADTYETGGKLKPGFPQHILAISFVYYG